MNKKEEIKKLKLKIKELKKQHDDYFNLEKFIRGLNIFSGRFWGKFLYNQIHNLIMILFLLLIFFLGTAIGWFGGVKNKDIEIGCNDTPKIEFRIDGDDRIHTFQIKDHKLYIDGVAKKVKDIPELKPYGIDIKPKLFVGYSKKEDMGVGTEIAHLWNFSFDMFGTRYGLFAGVSYDLDVKFLRNTNIGIAIGKDWDFENTLGMIYFSIRF